MILNTGCRTDIPAYYSRWFYNRIKEGYVCTRNPYRKDQVLKYRLDPAVVDILCFCAKNPAPMLPRLAELDHFRQFWFVTLTPYGKEIEPNVPDKRTVLESIRQLSAAVGSKAVGWRYDPIFITEKYSVEYHLQAFEKMASVLQNRVNSCVISFLDLYEKTKRNFPAAQAVTEQEQKYLATRFAEIPCHTVCRNRCKVRYPDSYLLRECIACTMRRGCFRLHDKSSAGGSSRLSFDGAEEEKISPLTVQLPFRS